MSTNKTIDLFFPGQHRCAHLIGGGGKTSLMFALSRLLVKEGRSVVTTTSTKILFPRATESESVIVGPWDSIKDRLESALRSSRQVTIARSFLEVENKLGGYAPPELDSIVESFCADYLLVEADGSAGRSLKAHRENEPVLSAKAKLLIVVIGIDCLGKPLNEDYVHRSALFSRRLNRPLNSAVTIDDVAAIVFHADGYLKNTDEDCEIIIFISKATTVRAKQEAAALAERLKVKNAKFRIHSVVIGEVLNGDINAGSAGVWPASGEPEPL